MGDLTKYFTGQKSKKVKKRQAIPVTGRGGL
jgi:hypothetical protein